MTVKATCTGAPLLASGGRLMFVTTRSDGGGSSISTGLAEAVTLLFSAAASNTLPRGSVVPEGTSVRTKT